MFESMLSSLGIAFFSRLIINCIALFFLVRICFTYGKTENGSSSNYYMFGIGIFVVTFSLKSIDISIGFAFGLFAIFSMLRYRTEVISFRDMTHLFLVIVTSLLCAVSPFSTVELLIVLSIVAGSAFIIEAMDANKKVRQQLVRYEKIENIKPENYHLLIEDLKQRTGLVVTEVAINSIDFVQDSASLTVFYSPHTGRTAATKSAAVSPDEVSESSGKVGLDADFR